MKIDLSQKYHPQCMAEILLPEDVRKKLEHCFFSPLTYPYIFTGPSGVGKTLVANQIRKDPYRLSCLKGGSDDDLYLLERAASAFTLNGERRTIFLDDVDHMLPKYQLHLIMILDQFKVNNDFIMTAREPYRLKEALRSRVQIIDFGISESKIFRNQIVNRLADIASKEGNPNVDLMELKKIVKTSYPDIRVMLRRLQVELL